MWASVYGASISRAAPLLTLAANVAPAEVGALVTARTAAEVGALIPCIAQMGSELPRIEWSLARPQAARRGGTAV